MIKSIWIKHFLIFTLLLIFFVVGSLLMNTFFLEKYIIYRYEGLFYDEYSALHTKYVKNRNETDNYIHEIERTKGLRIQILSSHSLNIINPPVHYPNSSEPFKPPPNKEDYMQNTKPPEPYKLPPNVVDYIQKNGKKLNSSYYYGVNIAKPYSTKFLLFVKRLDADNLFTIIAPLGVIEKSSSIANDFFKYLGMLVIILGILSVLPLSRKITHPIIELSNIAKEISNLNFTQRFNVNTKDEIGILGNSINDISIKLNTSMDQLVTVNNQLKEDIISIEHMTNMQKHFISSVSHELKTQIGLIKGYAEGIKYNFLTDEENKEQYCNVIIDQSNKMDKLVLDLLDLSYMESGMFTLEKSTLNLTSLINEVIDKHSHISQSMDVKVKLDTLKAYFVEADSFRIEQVLFNYLSNAINHVDEKKLIQISIQGKDNKIRVTVMNTGNNIPPEDLENIWLRYYKIDKNHSRKYSGSGLGLSIVKVIIDHHKGSYGVINTTEGVEFWFELYEFKPNQTDEVHSL